MRVFLWTLLILESIAFLVTCHNLSFHPYPRYVQYMRWEDVLKLILIIFLAGWILYLLGIFK